MNYMMFAKPSKTTGDLKRLTARLDKLFSEYIRRRDADCNGMVKCVTCGRLLHWKEGDCGHYVPRDRRAVRWTKTNAHFQCPYCNRFRNGEQSLHGMYIDRRYGKGTAQQLQDISRVRGCKIDQGWIILMIEDMKKELKIIKAKQY